MARILLALSSALLLILSFPRFDLEFLAWIALVPLFLAIRERSLKAAFGLSFLVGISFLEGVFNWINAIKGFTLLDNLLLGVYLGSYFGIFGLLLNFASRKRFAFVIAAPVLWVTLEYLRSHASFLGLPWALLGHSQYRNLYIIQIASSTGVYGVSFLIVMINAALTEVLSYLLSKKEKRTISNPPMPIKQAIIALLLLGASLIYGYAVISQPPEGDKINITVIQGNIPQDIKWNPEFLDQNMDKHVKLTEAASKGSNTSLIVWPESSVPGFLREGSYFTKTIPNLATETKNYLLIGCSQRPKFGSREFKEKHSFNSAFLISPKGHITGFYNKIHLLPFGEYLPYKDSFPWPSRFVSAAGNTIPGKQHTIFNLNGAKFGVLICWENIFPELFREFIKNGAQFMVNMTNEAWFGETAAPYQFVSMSVFRAAENRVSIARSANTGVSCFIDPYGRIMGRVQNGHKDIFVEGFLTMAIPLPHQKTFYTMHGDIFVYLVIATAIFMITLSLLKTKKE